MSVTAIIQAAIINVITAFILPFVASRVAPTKAWVEGNPSIAGGIFGALAATILLAFYAFFVPEKLPAGVIVAANVDCSALGATWSPLPHSVGRVIIGSGQTQEVWRRPDGTPQVLSSRDVGAEGGEETHILTVAEAPKNIVDLSGATSVWQVENDIAKVSYNFVPKGFPNSEGSTSNANVGLEDHAGGQPANVLPPYLAMNYCVRG